MSGPVCCATRQPDDNKAHRALPTPDCGVTEEGLAVIAVRVQATDNKALLPLTVPRAIQGFPVPRRESPNPIQAAGA